MVTIHTHMIDDSLLSLLKPVKVYNYDHEIEKDFYRYMK